jgi:hypothetical protein
MSRQVDSAPPPIDASSSSIRCNNRNTNVHLKPVQSTLLHRESLKNLTMFDCLALQALSKELSSQPRWLLADASMKQHAPVIGAVSQAAHDWSAR